MLLEEKILSSGMVYYKSVAHRKPVVVLLHGFGETWAIWQHMVHALQNEYTILVPELPGSGKSPVLEDNSITAMTDCVYNMLEQENIGNCILIGHSMGGYITLAFAEKYPEKLTAFSLFHSTAYPDNEEKKETRKIAIEFFKNNGARLFFKTATPNLFSPGYRAAHQNEINELIDEAGKFSVEALIKYYETMMERPDTTHVLRNTKVPVMIIAGKYDQAAPLQDLLEQCTLSPVCYFHILNNSGHMGMLEEPEKSIGLIKSFLDSFDKAHA